MRPQFRSALFLAGEACLVYALAWIYLHWLQFLSPHLSEPDVYYHIKAAWLMRTQGVLDAFPWAAASIWREAYFNKDFGFHVLLLPFTYGALAHGAKLAAVTYGALFVASFYLVLKLSRVRHPWVWTLLLLCAGGLFGYRINVARPHLLAMTLSMWTVYAILRRSTVAVGILALAYALCYTAPHMVIGYALAAYLVWGLREKTWHHRVPVAAVLGVAVGWLVHPNFPHNLTGWWLQNVAAIQIAWSHEALKLRPGAEMFPTDTRSFLLDNLTYVALAIGALWLWGKAKERVSARIVTLLVIAMGALTLACLSKRFAEYLVPFALWTLAEAWTAHAAQVKEAWRGFPRLVRAGWAVLALLLVTATGARTVANNRSLFSSLKPSASTEVAAWLYENTPKGSLVFTCDWDDAPELFFVNHVNRYLVFLDGTFMYAWRPALWRAWRLAADGLDDDPVRTIRDGLGASAGYCTADFSRLRDRLARDSRVELKLTPAGYLFRFKSEANGGAKGDAGTPAPDAASKPDAALKPASEATSKPGAASKPAPDAASEPDASSKPPPDAASKPDAALKTGKPSSPATANKSAPKTEVVPPPGDAKSEQQ